MDQYSMAQKIWLRLLRDFKISCRKLQYKENVFGDFQDLAGCPRKTVLYSSNKFGVMKPWTNIPWFRRFDLGFWQTSKQICRKLQYMENVFRKFQGLARFPGKIFFYSLTKFGIFQSFTNIYNLAQKILLRLLIDFKTGF